jgi:hypothetical protein
MRLNAALIDSGVTGGVSYFADGPQVRYRVERITLDWQPDFTDDDLLIVPNGANHVALYEARAAIAAFLQRGGVLFCFCGNFTPWIPGSSWAHDNRHPLRELRYEIALDPLGLMRGVDPEALCRNAHDIRGWWACGEILAEHPGAVVLRDNFGRSLMIADRDSSPGLIITTASGPLGDADPASPATSITTALYRNLIGAAQHHREHVHAQD